MKEWGVIVVLGIVMLIGLLNRDDNFTYNPTGERTGIIERTHPLKRTKFVNVTWARDRAYGETGWCVWAASPGELPRYHLVLGGDGETIYPTRLDWWRR